MKKRKIYLKITLSALAVALLLPVMMTLLVYAGAFGRLPDTASLGEIRNPVASEIYTADGVLMGKYYIQNRQHMDPGQISDTLVNALVATEDIRFYKHNGIDTRSLARVFFKTLLLGDRSSGGGSTLTQQLSKNLFPRQEYRILGMPVNKVREMATARRIEKVYTKDEILALYLSTVPFGENTFGIKSASTRFFRKSPRELRVEETALLVGMLKATGNYNPVRNPERAMDRRNVVLGQMARYSYLEQAAADSLSNLPLELNYNPLPHDAGIAPYFREFLRGELETWCENTKKQNNREEHQNRDKTGNRNETYNLYTDGLKIYTTIDSRLQQHAEQAMRDHMAGLQEIFEKQWQRGDLWKGMREEQLLINYDGKHRDKMSLEEPYNMEVFTWDGMQERDYNTLDSIKHYLQFLQAGFLAMDVRSGALKAWIGGINHQYFQYDHVLAKRQVGSVFKPVVYLAALEQGYSPCDYLPNDSVVYTEYEDWTPRNAGRTYGGYYSLQGALVKSVNTVSVNLLMELGIDTVIQLAQKAGIRSELPAVPSLALGTGNISLFEMIGVYQAIANHGVAKAPVYLSRIETRDGDLLYETARDTGGTAICQPENADLLTGMMRSVVNRGTAIELRTKFGITADVAGKTGTTQNYTDGYFMGFTPNLVAGAWVGGDLQNLRFKTMQYGRGSFTAMPIWAGFMTGTLQDDRWSHLRIDTFDISPFTKEKLFCDDFTEKKPFRFQPLKSIKEKPFFKKLRKRRKRK
ncbi:MAG: transglycosylase domain-containing protein [Bacteroidota bacterium]